MRETRADTRRALFMAVALHAVLFGLMFVGLWWTRTTAPLSAAGAPIEAELVSADALSARMKRVLAKRPEPVAPAAEPAPEPVAEDAAPPPQPLPEPAPQDATVQQQRQAQESIAMPDPVQQEEVRREAVSDDVREREQEAKRRQEQIDLTQQQRQEEAEQRRRLSEQQQQREKELADIRRQRAQAQREIDMREQRLKQIADREARQASQSAAQADASPPPGNNGVDDGLKARYAAELIEAIRSKWTRPDNAPIGATCKLIILQLPGGEVAENGVSFSTPCAYDEAARDSIERAVLKAQPLPYEGFQSVFQRRLILTFTAQ